MKSDPKDNLTDLIKRFFGWIRFCELIEGDFFKKDGDVFCLGRAGDPAKLVMIAYRKQGHAKFFRPEEWVKKITRVQFEKFTVDDAFYNAMHGKVAKRPAYGVSD